MSEHPPPPNPTESPAEPLYTHPASPFARTEVPEPVIFDAPALPVAQSTWVAYRAQVQFGLAMLAYLMVLVGSGTVFTENPDASWAYVVAALPAVPGALVLWVLVKALGRLDELQKRIQLLAAGFSLAATALITFAYGFLEGVGLPHLSWTFVLPLIVILWAVGTAVFTLRYR